MTLWGYANLFIIIIIIIRGTICKQTWSHQYGYNRKVSARK